jgi:hypothetical protein
MIAVVVMVMVGFPCCEGWGLKIVSGNSPRLNETKHIDEFLDWSQI